MNSMVQNSNPILSFLYDFDLLEEDVKFTANIDFVLNGKRKITEGQVQIKFDEVIGHALLTISNTKANETLLPVILDSRQHIFNYIPGITLQINGLYNNPRVGHFKVSIFPANN